MRFFMLDFTKQLHVHYNHFNPTLLFSTICFFQVVNCANQTVLITKHPF